MIDKITIRNAKSEEYETIGSILIDVYSALDGFPNKDVHPTYYDYLENIGVQTENEAIELFVAIANTNEILGSVVYYHDVKYYNSPGTVTTQINCCGFRLLAVTPEARGKGIGKKLTQFCIEKAQQSTADFLIIHTTSAMKTAWKMYENMGFQRAKDLDFSVGELEVFGFRYELGNGDRKKSM